MITCSALKRSYRDRLRGPHVVFVHLVGSAELVGKRLTKRIDHYMPPSLLQSQLDTLETPGPDENVLTVDIGRKPAAEADEIVERLGLHPEPRAPA